MNRLGSCYMHPLLLLITLVLLATSALSTEQSNPPKLRPERILENKDPIICRHMSCSQSRAFKGNKAIYSVLLSFGSHLGLQVTPDDERELIIDLEGDVSTDIYFSLVAYPPQIGIKSYEYNMVVQQEKTTITIPGPIGTVVMTFGSGVNNIRGHITLTITQPGNDGHNTTIWVSIGTLIVATIVVLCYYRRKRINRQRRYYQPVQPVQIRYQNLWERHQNAQLRQEVSSKQLSTQEIIDMRCPEARFEQFESYYLQKTCTICLDDMKKEQICRQLDCQHIFHTQCGKKWLENQFKKIKKAFCPNCNQQVNMRKKRRRA